jgi:hypothetical protein
MNLIATPLKYEDYDNILVGWWNDWKWVAPKRDFLPQDGMGGMIVWDGDKPVCAGFIYNTNSKVSWIDWVISDKNYKKKPERQDALELLLLTLGEVCKKEGNKYSYALLRHDKLIETYKKLGFRAGEQYSQEMIKIY